MYPRLANPQICNWSFLGLVRYIANFLPKLANHTKTLTELTYNECNKTFPEWQTRHVEAFESIKSIVTSHECLMTINLTKMPENKIYVTMDASDLHLGAILSFGMTWESAHPVTFDSMTFKGAELNYPVHEKELLVIICPLKQWHADLIGVPFTIYTDHKTLENFMHQKELSHHQARWMELMSQYDGKIVYIKGNQNSMADALSQIPTTLLDTTESALKVDNLAKSVFHNVHINGKIAAVLETQSIETFEMAGVLAATTIWEAASPTVLSITHDKRLIMEIKDSYKSDLFTKALEDAWPGINNITNKDGFWFIGKHLVVPCLPHIHEMLFQMVHNCLGHFGAHKSYEVLWGSYYWPNMQNELDHYYIPSCTDCQWNKLSMTKPMGPLHPLPIPDGRCESIAIDFIGPLPKDGNYDSIAIIMNRLGTDVQIILTTVNLTAEGLAELFFDKWFCKNGLPLDIVSDRDKLFMSQFGRPCIN